MISASIVIIASYVISSRVHGWYIQLWWKDLDHLLLWLASVYLLCSHGGRTLMLGFFFKICGFHHIWNFLRSYIFKVVSIVDKKPKIHIFQWAIQICSRSNFSVSSSEALLLRVILKFHTPSPWLLRISVMRFSLVRILKTSPNIQLMQFSLHKWRNLGLLMTWVLQIWFLLIFDLKKCTIQGPGVCLKEGFCV